jgi:hypothetical protein
MGKHAGMSFLKRFLCLRRFSELKTIRIAFEVYECQDLSGMEICSHVILRTLKVNNADKYATFQTFRCSHILQLQITPILLPYDYRLQLYRLFSLNSPFFLKSA